jgi:hypothetical protein
MGYKDQDTQRFSQPWMKYSGLAVLALVTAVVVALALAR